MKRGIVCVLALGWVACSWVPLTPGGEQVRLVSAAAAASCERIGKTRSKVADRVWIFARNEGRIRDELVSLARNEAADMGGDSVAPESRPEGGRQTFGVFRCGAA